MSEIKVVINDITRLSAKIAELETEITELEQTIEAKNLVISTLTERITSLEGEINTLQGEVVELSSQVASLTTQNQALTQQIQTLNEQISSLNTQITNMNSAIETINGETVLNPISYLAETKAQILTALQNKGSSATSSTTFRQYASEITAINTFPPAETTLLLHLDSDNGLNDSSSYHRPILTCGTGTPAIVTTESKFGNGSLYLDGTCGLYVNQTNFFPFQMPEWTVELFFKPVNWGATQTRCAFMWIDYTYPQTNARIYQGFSLTSTLAEKTFYFTHHDFSVTNNYNKSDYGYVNSLDMNDWHHLAITKNSNDSNAFARCYVDGVSTFVSPGYTSMMNLKYMTLESLPTNIYLGASFQSDTQTLDRMAPCYMNEIRFSSVCRYTSDFTPPTQPFTI